MVKETSKARLNKFRRRLMIPSQARQFLFILRAINIYLQHVLQTIIYFMKNRSKNIYFKNTPWRLNDGPLTMNKYHSTCSHFHPLEVVSRYRDPQLQVGENVRFSGLRVNLLFVTIYIYISAGVTNTRHNIRKYIYLREKIKT